MFLLNFTATEKIQLKLGSYNSPGVFASYQIFIFHVLKYLKENINMTITLNI